MMDVSLSGTIIDVKVGANSKGEVVTDAYVAQENRVVKCRWKGDVTAQVKQGVSATVKGRIYMYVSPRTNTAQMMLSC